MFVYFLPSLTHLAEVSLFKALISILYDLKQLWHGLIFSPNKGIFNISVYSSFYQKQLSQLVHFLFTHICKHWAKFSNANILKEQCLSLIYNTSVYTLSEILVFEWRFKVIGNINNCNLNLYWSSVFETEFKITAVWNHN